VSICSWRPDRSRYVQHRSGIGRTEFHRAKPGRLQYGGDRAVRERSYVHGERHAQRHHRHHDAVQLSRRGPDGGQFVRPGRGIGRAGLHRANPRCLQYGGDLAVYERRFVHGDDNARRQRQHEAVSICGWPTDWGQFVHPGRGIERAGLHCGQCYFLQYGGDRGICECRFMHGDERARRQRQHDAVPICSVGLHQCGHLHAGSPVERSRLYGCHGDAMPDYRHWLSHGHRRSLRAIRADGGGDGNLPCASHHRPHHCGILHASARLSRQQFHQDDMRH
jgi:hypothetical protein